MKFCLSEPLFRHVLEQVEKFPETTFTETELRKISSAGFDEMLRKKLLKYQQSDSEQETFPCPTPCEVGCDRVIDTVLGKCRAICPEYSEVKPISLTKSDLSKYIFDVDKLISIIRSKNQLLGSTNRINDRIAFVGEKSVGQKRVAVILGLFRNGKEAEAVLLGLSNQISIRDRTIVLLPFFEKTSQDVLMRMESQNILVSRFEDAFSGADFLIDFARLEKRKPKTGPVYPTKTQKQQIDYDKYGYLCEDVLFITGIEPKKRSNLVRVNDKDIVFPDNEMLLLICLAIELKKGQGGWVHRNWLTEEGITEEDYPYRVIGQLRETLSLGLLDGDGKRFIENKGAGSYRISTHPDFVIIEKKDWLVKKYNELKETKRKQMERAELQRKKTEEAERRKALLKQK